MIVSSQTGTGNTTSKDTSINLPKPVAKEVVKDIIKGDSAVAELVIVKKKLDISNINLSLKDTLINGKDSIISLYKQKESGYESIIKYKDNQFQIEKNLADDLNKKYKSEKRKRIFSNILLVFFTTASAIFLIK